jgi:hypothetical protein
MMVKMLMLVFWGVTPCGNVDGGSTVLQPRRTTSTLQIDEWQLFCATEQ